MYSLPSRFFYELQELSQVVLVKRSSLLLVGLLEQVDKPDVIRGHKAVDLKDKRHGSGSSQNKAFSVVAGEKGGGEGVCCFKKYIFYTSWTS